MERLCLLKGCITSTDTVIVKPLHEDRAEIPPLTLQTWFHKFPAPLIKLAKFECQDSRWHADEQKRQRCITGYRATVAFLREHFYTVVQKIHSYFHSTRLRVSSIVVARNWISRYRHALLNNSSDHQTLLAPTGNFLTSPTCKGDGGWRFIKRGKDKTRSLFLPGDWQGSTALHRYYWQRLQRERCAIKTSVSQRPEPSPRVATTCPNSIWYVKFSSHWWLVFISSSQNG